MRSKLQKRVDVFLKNYTGKESELKQFKSVLASELSDCITLVYFDKAELVIVYQSFEEILYRFKSLPSILYFMKRTDPYLTVGLAEFIYDNVFNIDIDGIKIDICSKYDINVLDFNLTFDPANSISVKLTVFGTPPSSAVNLIKMPTDYFDAINSIDNDPDLINLTYRGVDYILKHEYDEVTIGTVTIPRQSIMFLIRDFEV